MLKSELRKIYLEKQRSLSDEEREEKSRKIADAFFEKFNLNNVSFLHLFLSLAIYREIKTVFIYKRLWQDFPAITTLVPRVNFQTMTLDTLKFNSTTLLCSNKWGIAEPKKGRQEGFFEIEKIDLVLVPLLCFDERGFRIGYGKGFYDKFLSECRADCLKIGLSYFAPIAEIADAQLFDVRMDFCVTPEKIWKWKSDKVEK